MEPELVDGILKVEAEHWWFRARRTLALDFIARQIVGRLDGATLKILDVGAGSGYMAEALRRFGKVEALEFGEQSVARLRQRDGIDVHVTKLPDASLPNASYDLLTSFDVLEHIENDEAVLEDMARLVKPGGFALITVPAHQWLWTSHDEVNHHRRRYAGRELREKVLATGLQPRFFSAHLSLLFPLFLLQRIMYRLFPPKKADAAVHLPGRIVNGLLYWLYAVERFFLGRRIPLPFGASYLVLLQKPGSSAGKEAARTKSRKWFDLRALLSVPVLYSAFRQAVTGSKEHRIFAKDYVRARRGDRVLDVGCGPADLLADLPEVDYTGFDLSAAYIATAVRRFGDRGKFYRRLVNKDVIAELGPGTFDVVLAHGLLHHLSDAEAVEFFEMSHTALKPGGRVVTLDGCYVDGQSRMARYLLSKDRGEHVRTREEYLALARRVFNHVQDDIRHDMYRIPYTLILLQCTN